MSTNDGSHVGSTDDSTRRARPRSAPLAPGGWGAGGASTAIVTRHRPGPRPAPATRRSRPARASRPARPVGRLVEVEAPEEDVRDVVDEAVELLAALHLDRAGPRQVDRHHLGHRGGPGRQHDDRVGQQHGLVDGVGDQQRGGHPVHPDALELEVHAAPGHLVERAERLVEQEHRRVGHQRPGDGHPLAHAPGELGRPGTLEAVEPHERDEVGDGRGRGLVARDLQRQADVLGDRAPGQQRSVLEGDAQVVALAGHRRGLPLDQHLAGGGLFEVGQDAQHRRLAAPRRADQGRERPGRGRVVDGVDRRDRAAPDRELLAEPLDEEPARRAAALGGGHDGVYSSMPSA